MNKFCFILFFLFAPAVFAQKNVIVLDKFSGKPIENVTLYFPKSAAGTFTNTDGKAIIPGTDKVLKLSHLNYRDTTIILKTAATLDSIFLLPKAIELHQVSISSFNMRKSLNYILDHYDELYVDVSTAKECTFKEAFLINNQYKRFILSQIEWWSKSSAHPLNGNYSRFTKLKLGNIDFYKNEPMGIFGDSEKQDNSSKSSYLEPKTLIDNIYFNYVIHIILSYPEEIHTTMEDSAADQLIVSFETEPKKFKEISSVAKGKIVFDKTTKAIVQYRCAIEFVGNVDEIKDGKGGFYTYEQQKSIADYSFEKSINNKLSLKRCDFHAEGIMNYKNKQNAFTFENSLYVLQEKAMKKIDDKGVIDLNKSIYHNFPSTTVVNSNPILLSNSEQEFINQSINK